MKPTILILCTGNSCRSHIGEGFLRAALGDSANVQSAGSNPAGHVHPLAIKVMAEAGIDISTHRSKHLKEFLEEPVSTVITVCGNADQACPIFPGQVNRHHWGFEDPAHATGSEIEAKRVQRADQYPLSKQPIRQRTAVVCTLRLGRVEVALPSPKNGNDTASGKELPALTRRNIVYRSYGEDHSAPGQRVAH